jgi:hypothetical protein
MNARMINQMAGGVGALAVAALMGEVCIAQSVQTVDGRVVAGALVSLGATNAVVQGQKGQETISLGDIASIRFQAAGGDALLSRKGQQVLIAVDGSMVGVRNVTVSNGQLRAISESIGEVSIPMESLSCLLRPGSSETPRDLQRERERLNLKPRRNDVLVVRSESGKCIPVDAVIDRMDSEQVVFSYDRTESSMKTDTIAILVPAAPANVQPPVKPLGQVIGTDGSCVFFSAAEAGAGRVAVVSPAFGKLGPAATSIAEIRFKAAQVTYLSDFRPKEVKEKPFFDDEFPWQKDRSVSGGPLVLEGMTYDKGMGLHAECRMVFDLEGQYRRFTAVAGIDGQLQSGKAVLTVLADGKAVADRIPLARNKPPVQLDLDVKGARELVVLVGFADGTMGDGARVNICDPVLAR